jgi:hypothetical protein
VTEKSVIAAALGTVEAVSDGRKRPSALVIESPTLFLTNGMGSQDSGRSLVIDSPSQLLSSPSSQLLIPGVQAEHHSSGIESVAQRSETKPIPLPDEESDAPTGDTHNGSRDESTDSNNLYYYHHPAGVAVKHPPQQIPSLNGSTAAVEWAWRDKRAGYALSQHRPEILVEVNSIDSLNVGDEYRWMHQESYQLSAMEEKLKDVGSGCAHASSSTDIDIDNEAPGDDRENLRGSAVVVIDDDDDAMKRKKNPPPSHTTTTTTNDHHDGIGIAMVDMNRNPMMRSSGPGRLDNLMILRDGVDAAPVNDVQSNPLHHDQSAHDIDAHIVGTTACAPANHSTDEALQVADVDAVEEREDSVATAGLDDFHSTEEALQVADVDAVEDQREDSVATAGLDDFSASLLFHSDTHDAKVLHGPFTLEDYREWLNSGHFTKDTIVRSLGEMKSIPLSQVLREKGDGDGGARNERRDDSGTDNGVVSEGDVGDEFFHLDAEHENVLHGPYTRENYRSWWRDGEHDNDTVVKISFGRMKSFPLSDVLRADDDGAFYTKAEYLNHYEEDGRDRWETAKT